jgi:dephospho-CoA kinase
MEKIGLTGGIGSGKSTVARILAKLGARLIDADALSRAATASGGVAMPAVRAAFGEGIAASDGGLNRDVMREIMLSDPRAKAKLEGILHPLIGDQINQQLTLAKQAKAKIVVLDIPLLVEGGSRWRSKLDAVWVVDCRHQTQVSRVQERSGWPVAQIEAVIAAQASRVQRWAAADAVVFNDGLNLIELEHQVTELLHLVKQEMPAGACTMITANR